MPPAHPALVHFPIALVTLSVVADALGFVGERSSLHAAGWWALVGAALSAALAIPAGLFDMNREQIGHDGHHRVHRHMKVGFVLFAALAGLTMWRWLIYIDQGSRMGWGYVVAAVLVLGLTFVQGWLGAELVFSDGVGVAPTGQGTERPRKAKNSAARPAGGETGERGRESAKGTGGHAGH